MLNLLTNKTSSDGGFLSPGANRVPKPSDQAWVNKKVVVRICGSNHPSKIMSRGGDKGEE